MSLYIFFAHFSNHTARRIPDSGHSDASGPSVGSVGVKRKSESKQRLEVERKATNAHSKLKKVGPQGHTGMRVRLS